MPFGNIIPRLASVLFLTAVLTMPQTADAVFCLSDDGHAAIESAHESHCNNHAEASASLTECVHPEPCLDLPLSLGARFLPKASAKIPLPPRAFLAQRPLLLSNVRPESAESFARFPSRPLPRTDSALLALKTVVLRT